MDEQKIGKICKGIRMQVGRLELRHYEDVDMSNRSTGGPYSSGNLAGQHLDEYEMEIICRGISRQVGRLAGLHFDTRMMHECSCIHLTGQQVGRSACQYICLSWKLKTYAGE